MKVFIFMIVFPVLLVAKSSIFLEFPLRFPNVQDTKNKNVNKELIRLKQLQNSKEWESCSTLAKKVYAKEKIIKDWILLTWIRCAKNTNESSVRSVLQEFDSANTPKFGNPVNSQLIKEIIESRVQLIESKKLSSQELILHVDKLLAHADRLDRETKAKIYYFLSEVLQGQHQIKGAEQMLEFSLAEKETHIAREKYKAIELALGEKEDVEAKITDWVLPENERKAEERLEQSDRKNDFITFVEDGISYLNNYPNGRKAKMIQEKILDIYIQVADHLEQKQEDEQKYIELRDKLLSLFAKADYSRIFEWAKSLHRRGDYFASLDLSERIMSSYIHSPQVGSLLWMLGRSSQFTGDYSKAQKYFEQYLLLNSGGEDFNEISFRLALVHLRNKKYSSANAVLEKFLLRKNIDRYELAARYWLIRSLEAENNPRAKAEADNLIEKYPFSYYGLRLRAEKQEGVISFPEGYSKIVKLDSTLFLTPYQAQLLEKIKYLAKHGWYFEAQKEISNFPVPKDPTIKVLLAQEWNKAKAFPMVVRMTSDAIDTDQQFKNLNILAPSFPNEYESVIKQQSEKNKLNPILIKSLIRQESAFGRFAVSSSNAMGLMQLIPPTANEVAQDLKLGKLEIPEDVFDPEVNIQLGSFYIAKMIQKFGGSVPLGLAAYNAGPQKIARFIESRSDIKSLVSQKSSAVFDEMWIDELPWAETCFYVKAILRNALLYKTLDQGKVNLLPVIWSDLVQTHADTKDISHL